MSGIVRLAARIDASDLTVKPQTVTVPIRMVRITAADVSDPSAVAMQMTHLHDAITKATLPARSHPEQGPMTFERVICGVSGAKVQIPHNLNKPVEYIITKWSSRPLPAAATAAGPSLVSDEQEAVTTRRTDANNLWLKSYVAGMATIRVY